MKQKSGKNPIFRSILGPRLDNLYNVTTPKQVDIVESIVPVDRFPHFTSRTTFDYNDKLSWFPSHMNRGTNSILEYAKSIDAILEVRDARAPLSSTNPTLIENIFKRYHSKKIARIILLNKIDLADQQKAASALNLLEQAGIPCLLTNCSKSSNVIKVLQFVQRHCRPQHKSIGSWMMVLGLPNVGKSSLINSMKRLAFSEGRYSMPGNRIIHNIAQTKAKTGPLPGLTKQVSHFKISNSPRLFCLDAPGIMIPRQETHDIMMRLAALGCVDDHRAGEAFIGDYILYRLNKERNFKYVDVLELPGPNDDIQMVSSHISQMLQRTNYLRTPQSYAGAVYFTKLFRSGQFGPVGWDEMPGTDLCFEDRREPPDPWERCTYSDYQIGLR